MSELLVTLLRDNPQEIVIVLICLLVMRKIGVAHTMLIMFVCFFVMTELHAWMRGASLLHDVQMIQSSSADTSQLLVSPQLGRLFIRGLYIVLAWVITNRAFGSRRAKKGRDNT